MRCTTGVQVLLGISLMWPFKRAKTITLQEVAKEIAATKVQTAPRVYKGLEEWSGTAHWDRAMHSVLVIVENKHRRHCRIGKIVFK